MAASDTESALSLAEGQEIVPNNGLRTTGPPFELEKVYDYETGGHHPVHLNDILHHRYKVVHKLGSGGYANVWLCLDNSDEACRYVALKVIMAEDSTKDCPELQIDKLAKLGLAQGSSGRLFCTPLDKFEIDGPNGVHYVFVYPVLGPRVSRLFNLLPLADMGPPLRRISLQATQAMAKLHAHGICHGDFRPANILVHISGLDGLSEDRVLELLGRPQTNPVVTDSGEQHDQESAPGYLVYPIDWERVMQSPSGSNLIREEACLIDFGESFDVSEPPSEVGIPQVYCSPEYSLKDTIGASCDLWALGCTLFEIRTGRKLFDTFDDDRDEYLYRVAMTLGKFPEPWWSTIWEQRREYFEDETDRQGLVVKIARLLGDESDAVVHQLAEPRSVRQTLARGLFYEYKDHPSGVHRNIPPEEIELLSDLLAMILRYSPEERLTASKALEHDWFNLGLE